MRAANGNRVRGALVAVLTLVFVLTSLGAAAGPKKKKKAAKKKTTPAVTVIGTVEAKTGNKGQLVSVKFMAEDGNEYRVVLNRTGKKLATDGAGKTVEATGRSFMKGKKKKKVAWLNVTKFTLKEAPSPEPEPEDEDDPLPDGDDPTEDWE